MSKAFNAHNQTPNRPTSAPTPTDRPLRSRIKIKQPHTHPALPPCQTSQPEKKKKKEANTRAITPRKTSPPKGIYAALFFLLLFSSWVSLSAVFLNSLTLCQGFPLRKFVGFLRVDSPFRPLISAANFLAHFFLSARIVRQWQTTGSWPLI